MLVCLSIDYVYQGARNEMEIPYRVWKESGNPIKDCEWHWTGTGRVYVELCVEGGETVEVSNDHLCDVNLSHTEFQLIAGPLMFTVIVTVQCQ